MVLVQITEKPFEGPKTVILESQQNVGVDTGPHTIVPEVGKLEFKLGQSNPDKLFVIFATALQSGEINILI